MTTLRLVLNAEPLLAAFSDLIELAESVLHPPPGIIDALQVPFELCVVENDADAAGTCNLSVTAKPSDGFLMLLAALRAGNLNNAVVK